MLEADQASAWADWQAIIDGVFGDVLGSKDTESLKRACWALFEANLDRGRSLLAGSLIKAVDSARGSDQQDRSETEASDAKTRLAAVFAVVNSQIPEVGKAVMGEILRVFKVRVAHSDTSAPQLAAFMAELANNRAVHWLVVLEMAAVLKFVEQDFSALHRLGRFKNEPAVKYLWEGPFDSGLVLVEPRRNVEHDFSLDDSFANLPGYEWDDDWGESQANWAAVQEVVWGRDPVQDPVQDQAQVPAQATEGESGRDESVTAVSSGPNKSEPEGGGQGIVDMTNSAGVNLKKQIYLTIMSALTSAEAVHKLMRLDAGESEIVTVLLECCAQEKTSNKLYADIGFRLARSKGNWRGILEEAFGRFYFDSHQHTTGELRNVGRLFGYLFAADALDWTAFSCVQLSPTESTPSNRIFLQAVFQEMRDEMGIGALKKRLAEPFLKESLEGVFPSEPASLRFAINYFTAIGLGPLTDEMRLAL